MKNLKKILNSNEAYAILDASKAGECTWSAGGCLILADALEIAFGWPVYGIFCEERDQIEHFMAKSPTGYVDFYGIYQDPIKGFKKEYKWDFPRPISEYTFSLQKTSFEDEIPKDLDASKKLAELIKSKIISEIIKNEIRNLIF